jgi:hypothetical protein
MPFASLSDIQKQRASKSSNNNTTSNVSNSQFSTAYDALKQYKENLNKQKDLEQQTNKLQEDTTQNQYDTTNWTQASGLEKALHGASEWTEQNIYDLFGSNEAYQKMKDEWSSNNLTDNVSNAANWLVKFAADLPGGMAYGLASSPERYYEAATGRNLQEMQDGKVSNVELTGQQKLATAADAAIDSFGMLLGGSGKLIKGVSKLGGAVLKGTAAGEKAAAKQAAKEASGYVNPLKQVKTAYDDTKKYVSDAAKSAVNYDKWSKPAKSLTSLGYSAGEEGAEEFTQEFLQEIRGTEQEHGIEAVDSDTLSRAWESAALGALGGGIFHGAGKLASKGAEKLGDELSKAIKNNTSQDAAIELNSENFSDVDISRDYSENSDDARTAPAIARAIDENQTNTRKKANSGFFGTLLAGKRVRGNDITLSAKNIVDIAANNKANTDLLDGVFRSTSNLNFDAYRQHFINLVANNDIDGATQILDYVANRKMADGDPIVVVFAKQPATNGTPIKARVTGFNNTVNAIEVDQVVADYANADFDADKSFISFNPEDIANASYLTDKLIDTNGDSILDYTTDQLDPEGMTESQIDKMCNYLETNVYGKNDLSAARFSIKELGPKNKYISLRKAFKEISKITDEKSRNRALAQLYTQLNKQGHDLSFLWGDIYNFTRDAKIIADYSQSQKNTKANAVENVRKYCSAEKSYKLTQQAPKGMYAETVPEEGGAFAADMSQGGAPNTLLRQSQGSVSVAYGDVEGPISIEGQRPRRVNEYEAMFLTELDMVGPGIHDNSKIMGLFNRALKRIINLKIGIDFSIEDVFNERMIKAINDEIDKYNDAIKEVYFEGRETAAGQFTKPRVVAPGKKPGKGEIDIYELLAITYGDSTISELIKPVLNTDAYKENQVINEAADYYLADFYQSRYGDRIGNNFFGGISKSDGSLNEDIGKLFSEMQRAFEKRARQQEGSIKNALAKLFFRVKNSGEKLSNKEIRERLSNMDEDVLSKQLDDDLFSKYAAFAEIVGPQNLVRCNLWDFKHFKESDIGKIIENENGTTSEEDLTNAAFCTMFRGEFYETFQAIKDVFNDPTFENVERAKRFIYNNRTNNKFFASVNYDLLCVLNLVTEESSESEIQRACVIATDKLNYFASTKVTFEKKQKEFNVNFATVDSRENFADESSYSNDKGIPLLIHAKAGFKGKFSDLGISSQIAMSQAYSSTYLTENEANMTAEINELESFCQTTAGKQWADANFALAIEELADPNSITVDSEVQSYRIRSYFELDRAQKEKGRSTTASSRFADIVRTKAGQVFQGFMGQNTNGTTGLTKVTDFIQNRTMLLNMLSGKFDPTTGKRYVYYVQDAKNQTCYPMSYEEVFGLQEGETATWQDYIDFFKANPNVASWMCRAVLKMNRIGEIESVGLENNEKGSLKDTFIAAAERHDKTNHQKQDVRREVLNAAERLSERDALIALSIELDKDGSPEGTKQFDKKCKKAQEEFDEWALWQVAHYKEQTYKAESQKEIEDFIFAQVDAMFSISNSELENDDMFAEAMSNIVDQTGQSSNGMWIMQAIFNRPDFKQYFPDADMAEVFKQRTDLTSSLNADAQTQIFLSQLVTGLQLGYVKKMLVSTGTITDPLTEIKQSIDINSWLDVIADPNMKQYVRDAFDNFTIDQLLDVKASDGSTLRGLYLDSSSFYDEQGTYKGNDNVIDIVSGYLEEPYRFEIGLSEIRDEIIPQIRNILTNPNPTTDELNAVLALAHRRASLGYLKRVAVKRNLDFDPDALASNLGIVQRFVERLHTMIVENYYPDFDENQSTLFANAPKPPTPNFRITDPVNAYAALQAINSQTSGDTETRIGMEGVTPRMLSVVGGLRQHSCEVGETRSVQDLAAIDFSKQENKNRYVAMVPRTIAEKLLDKKDLGYSDNVDMVHVTLTNDVMSNLVKGGVTDDLVVIDKDNSSDSCPSGLCRDHYPAFFDFLIDICQFSQENRVLKLKKVLQIISDNVKGRIIPGTQVDSISIEGQKIKGVSSILTIWQDYIQKYATSIRLNATDQAVSGFGNIDSAVNWCDFAEPFAKMFTPYVTVFFDNGDTGSVSIDALMHARNEATVADPLHQEGVDDPCHPEMIDWSRVERVEVRAIDADTLSEHYLQALENQREAAGVDELSDKEIRRGLSIAARDWSSMNRYCEATDSKTKYKHNPNYVLGQVRFLGKTMHDYPVYHVQPSTINRYLLGNDKPSGSVPYKVNPISNNFKTQDDENALKLDFTVTTVSDDPTNYVVGGIATNMSYEHGDRPWTKKLDSLNQILQGLSGSVDNRFKSKSGSNYCMVIDYDAPGSNRDAIRSAFFAAADYGNKVLVTEDEFNMLQDILSPGNDSTFNISSEGVYTFNSVDYYMVDPIGTLKRRSSYKQSQNLTLYQNADEPYMLFIEADGQNKADSSVTLTNEGAKNLVQQFPGRRVDYETGISASNLHMVINDSEITSIEETIQKIRQEEMKNQRDGVKINGTNPNSDVISDTFVNTVKTAPIKKNAGDTATPSDSIILRRMELYLKKVRQSGTLSPVLDVNQGDIIAIYSYTLDGNTYLVPIMYQGPSAHADYIEFKEDDVNGEEGNKITFYATSSADMSNGDSAKMNLSSLNTKAMTCTVADFDIDLTYSGETNSNNTAKKHGISQNVNMPIRGMLEKGSMGSRLVAELKDRQTKLALFVTMRQYISYDLFAGINETNIGDYFENPDTGFSVEEILRAVNSTNPTFDANTKKFWYAIADGSLRLKSDNNNVTNYQRESIGKLIRSFINAGINPTILMRSQKNGSPDSIVSPLWDPVLSSKQNITTDDVFAFCNFVDPSFCPSDAREVSSRELLDGIYFVGMKSGDLKCAVTFKGDAPINKIHGNPANASYRQIVTLRCSPVYFSETASEGSVSNKADFNRMLDALMLQRNGVRGSNAQRAIGGMRNYRGYYSTEDINSLLRENRRENEEDIAAMSNFGLTPEMPKFLRIQQDGRPSRVAKAAKNNIQRCNRFYEDQHIGIWDQDKNGEEYSDSELQKNYLDKYQRKFGKQFNRKTLMNLVVMRMGWTATSTTKDGSKNISFKDFQIAESEIAEMLLSSSDTWSGVRKLFTPELFNTKYSGTSRLCLGVMTRSNLEQFISAMGDKLSTEEKQTLRDMMVENLGDDTKKLLYDITFGSTTYKSIVNNMLYYEMVWKGIPPENASIVLFDCMRHSSEIDPSTAKLLNISDDVRDLEVKIREEARIYRENVEAGRRVTNRQEFDPDSEDLHVQKNNRKKSGEVINRALNKAVAIRQMTAMASATVPIANITDTYKNSLLESAANSLGKDGLFGFKVGPYTHSFRRGITVDNTAIDYAVNGSENARMVLEAFRLAKALDTSGTENMESLQRALDKDEDLNEWIKERTKIERGHVFQGVYGKLMRFGSASSFGRKRFLRNFLNAFIRESSKYEGVMKELDQGSPTSLERMLMEDPTSTIKELFAGDYREAAMAALNIAEKSALNQENFLTWIMERAIQRNDGARFVNACFAGVPFMKATINMTGRTLKWVIPGMSSIHYVVVDTIANNPDAFTSGPMALILKASTKFGGDTSAKERLQALQKEFAAEQEALKGYANLQEAIYVDLLHLSLPAIALVLAMAGAVQPPEGGDDDDDTGLNSRYYDYTEWTIFGQPMSFSWWVTDLIGPTLPLACFWKANIDGNPGGSILLNGIGDMINMSPLTTADNIIDMIIDPEKALEEYETTEDWYADAPSNWLELAVADFKIFTVSWASNMLTPKIVKEISQISQPYEVSYNRVYQTNATGDLVEGAKEQGLTQKTDYVDAQIRKLCKNNYALGLIMDLAHPNATTGYTASEMPNQYFYDSDQLNFMHAYTVWDYDTDTYKSDSEIESVCASIVSMLAATDDMAGLYNDGFYLDSYTKAAVSDYIWGLYQDEVDRWYELEQSGQLSYTVAGNGNWTEGQEIVSQLKQEHYRVLDYYKQTLYYDKLRSDELNQGLVKYNRYNTTYKIDSNGNYYASGEIQGLGGLFSPLGIIGTNNTNGYEGGYASLSAVTGEGMYDDNGLPMRGLSEVVQDDYDWPSFDELGSTKTTSTSTYTPSTTTSSSSGYKSYSRSGGSSGGSSSRSSRSYGSSGSSYIRSSSGKTYGQGSRVYAPTYTNGRRTTSSHNVNFNRPNLPNVLDAKKIYDPTLDYLRPDFETKGSREAYRRSDF